MKPGDWLQSLTSEERKEVAVSRGLYTYFPDALALVARHSVRSNEKHNPGQPVHWAREKSTDHEDCIARHSIAVAIDPDSLDGTEPHVICRAWRALAALQLWAEKQKAAPAKEGGWRDNVTGSMPCSPTQKVEVRFRAGGVNARYTADKWTWTLCGESSNIVAWRPIGEILCET